MEGLEGSDVVEVRSVVLTILPCAGEGANRGQGKGKLLRKHRVKKSERSSFKLACVC